MRHWMWATPGRMWPWAELLSADITLVALSHLVLTLRMSFTFIEFFTHLFKYSKTLHCESILCSGDLEINDLFLLTGSERSWHFNWVLRIKKPIQHHYHLYPNIEQISLALTSSDWISPPSFFQWWQLHLTNCSCLSLWSDSSRPSFLCVLLHAITLPLPSKYSRNPATSHQIQYHHPGLGHHFQSSIL